MPHPARAITASKSAGRIAGPPAIRDRSHCGGTHDCTGPHPQSHATDLYPSQRIAPWAARLRDRRYS